MDLARHPGNDMYVPVSIQRVPNQGHDFVTRITSAETLTHFAAEQQTGILSESL